MRGDDESPVRIFKQPITKGYPKRLFVQHGPPSHMGPQSRRDTLDIPRLYSTVSSLPTHVYVPTPQESPALQSAHPARP